MTETTAAAAGNRALQATWAVLLRVLLLGAVTAGVGMAFGALEGCGDAGGSYCDSLKPSCGVGAACGCVGMDPQCDCSDCQTLGKCHYDGTTCVPQSDADCDRPNGGCEVFGWCHVGTSAGVTECVAVGPEDCRGSTLCRDSGGCSLTDLGSCTALTDADCAGSRECKDFGCCRTTSVGACVGTDGTCVLMCSGCITTVTVSGGTYMSSSSGPGC